MENNIVLEQKPADLNLECFLKRIYPGSEINSTMF